MIQKKFIETSQVIEHIFKSPDFPYLREHILDSDEISIVDGEPVINYFNGKNFNNNVYTDLRKNSPLKWLGVYDDDQLVCLQLIQFDGDQIELIIIERNPNYIKDLSLFSEVIDFCKQFNLPIITFPENRRLSKYYQGFGFKKISHGYLELV